MKYIIIAILLLTGCPPETTGAVSVQKYPFERIDGGDYPHRLYRIETPEGWLVQTNTGQMIYIPDQHKAWLRPKVENE